METKTAWLIEMPGNDNMPTRYWSPDTGWMLDPHAACWFVREPDARGYLKHTLLSGVRVAEHKFGLTLAQAKASPPNATS